MKRSPPKLLFFVTVDWFFASHFLARAIAAQEAGYEVLILTSVTHHGEMIRNAGLRLIPLRISRRSLNPIEAIRVLFQVARLYRAEKPDIIHHVALKPILLGGFAARLVGRKRVVNALVGGGYAFTSQRLSTRLLRPFIQSALKLVLNPRGSKVVFENKDDLTSFSETGLVKAEDAVLIRGAGVDPMEFHPQPFVHNPPVVALVARLLWDKGIGEFVEAARILNRRGVKARFVVVGGADSENRACIDALTLESWKTEGVVELWGFRNDIPEVLAQTTIACLPSYREGLPKFLLEAMAMSLPCVTTDVPGCREAVRNDDNGLLVPAKDAVALADAIAYLLQNPEQARKMGQRGRERVEQEFSTQHVNQSTLMLYQEMLLK